MDLSFFLHTAPPITTKASVKRARVWDFFCGEAGLISRAVDQGPTLLATMLME
jgi:hypothetical protein